MASRFEILCDDIASEFSLLDKFSFRLVAREALGLLVSFCLVMYVRVELPCRCCVFVFVFVTFESALPEVLSFRLVLLVDAAISTLFACEIRPCLTRPSVVDLRLEPL